MTINFTNPVAKFGATLATGAMLTLSTVTASHAANNTVLVIDDMTGLYTACFNDAFNGEGSTLSETETSFSCTTSDGQTTTCEKSDSGSADECGTDVATKGRSTGGKPTRIIDRVMAPLTTGKSQSNGSTPRPGNYIMQYSVQHSVQN